MNKPQLCLSLAFTVALLQANLLQASASPASPAIWEKLAGVKSSDTHSKVSRKPVAKQSAVQHAARPAVALAGTYNAAGVTSSGASGQVMLLFGKDKDAAGQKAPAAALTIHSSMPEQESAPAVASEPQPKLVAMDTAVATDAVPVATSLGSKQLLAQLAPDQIMSGAETATTPIPPVVSGTVDLEEFKPSNTIDLKVSQSRTFKLRNKIIRTSISDPAIAEPVVVAENQMVMLGKAPGGATLVIWDDAGNSVALDIKVSRDYSQLQAMLREIDPRIIVKPFSVGGADRVVLMGDVDHAESVIRAFAVANAFMDDRGLNITVANGRVLGTRPGEQGGAAAGGQQAGALSAIGQVDRYTFFGNQNNNISKAQTILSDGGRVTGLIQVRKTPLIVLHTTFMEMNSASARELGLQLGIGFTSQSFGFNIGGNSAAPLVNAGLLASSPGINGTFGTAANPLSIAQGGGTAVFTPQVNVNGGGAAGINVLTNPLGGFLGQPFFVGPGKNAFYGATTSPVNFLANGAGGVPTNLGLGVINGPPTLLAGQSLFGNPGGAAFTVGDLANMFQAVSNFASGNASRWSINPTVQGTIGYSRARVLAEPTLVTISGERASFLAGGEIPILQSIATAGTAAQSIVFEPYGLRLNMIPILLENGTINLQVSPEERLLDRANAFTLPAQAAGAAPSVVPAFVTRKCQTTVELKPGQELFISGLVSQNSGRQMQKTPMLGEVPVLGALYRSKAFAKNESELIIAVRPEVILPGSPGQLKIPGELNKMEAVRDTNIFQVEPSVIDESQYRSGLVEKSFQIPNTLPAGAPIPDSK
ncbi:MAG: pilus assembly protein N-terminal domain-containing protein [Candidatus Obscuribacterales bacterium]|nr:pilus assembly protein N-terminal domain-containing protein [Candidatus Obscuribacterales bacterium]